MNDRYSKISINPLYRRTAISIASIALWVASSLHAESLREAATQFPGLRIGAAISASTLTDGEAAYANTLRQQFNSPSPENATKWDALRPSQSTFNWTGADTIARFDMAAGQQFRGHALLWYKSLPGWLINGGFTASQARALLFDHIDTVATHYRGEAFCWDVVNEAFKDDGSLRDGFWYNSPGIGDANDGTRYIEEAFLRTAAADPDAVLIYNDYGDEELNPKSDAIFAMAQDFKSRGVPLHGIGFQMHIASINTTNLRNNFKRFNDLGMDLHITEMDVRIPVDGSGKATAANLDAQAEVYWDVLGVALAQPRFKSFQTWGLTDKYSWIPGFYPGYGAALLFDESYQRKPAYWAVWNALANQAEKLPVLDVSAGDSTNIFAQESLSAGAGRQLVANGLGDSMTLSLAVPFPGMWNVKTSYRVSGASGQFQLALAPENSGSFTSIGSVIDTYSSVVSVGMTNFGNVNFPSAGNWRIRFTLAGKNANASGYNLTIDTIRITPIANPANTPPSISNITDQLIDENTTAGPINFTISDTQSSASSLTVQAVSLNTTLLPTANIVFSGGGANRTVTLTPIANTFGSAAVLLLVSDGFHTTPETFTLHVAGTGSNSNWIHTTPGSSGWSTVANWLPANVPENNRATELNFFDGLSLDAGTVIITNDLAGTFNLNSLTLSGTGADGAASGVILGGAPLRLTTRPNNNALPMARLTANKSSADDSSLVWTVENQITLENDTSFSGNGNADFIFSGQISGNGGLTKTGSSLLRLSASNGYLGSTRLSGGTLDVGSLTTGSLGAGAIFFTDGGILQGNGTFTRSLSGNPTPSSGQISGTNGGFAAKGGQLTINFGGSLVPTGIALSNGNYRFGTNLIFGSPTADSPVVVLNPISLGGADRTITVTSGTGGDFAELSGAVSDVWGITKSGRGLLVLSGNNAQTGKIIIAAGTLRAAHNNALGVSSAKVALAGTDGVLEIANGITINRPLTIDDTGNKKTLRLQNGALTGAYSGTILMNETSPSNFDITTAAGQTFTISGKISGTAGAALTKRGDGTLRLTDTNDYTTPTVIAGGIVTAETLTDAGVPGSLGAASDVSGNLIINGGTLRHDATNVVSTNRKFAVGLGGASIDSSAANPNHSVNFSTIFAMGFNSEFGARTLTLTGSNSGENTFRMDINDDPSGNPTGLVKEGVGKWLLTGAANDYTGNTTVNGGILVLANHARLKFLVTDATATRMAGTGKLILDGSFVIDTSAVSLTEGSWSLVDVENLDESFSNSFFIAGWTQTNNVWTRMEGTRSWTFAESTGILTLSNPYLTWINGFTSIPAEERKPGDDPDHDGSPNLLEFALMGNPSDPSKSGLIASLIQDSSAPAGNELTLVIAAREGAVFNAGSATISGISYRVEGSTNLAFPSSAVSGTGPSDTAPTATGLPDLTGTEWKYYTFKLDASEGLDDRGFLRLKVSQP